MDQWLPLEYHAPTTAVFHGRAVGIVQHAFHQIVRRQQILGAQLILNSNSIAAKIIGLLSYSRTPKTKSLYSEDKVFGCAVFFREIRY
jgi:hypothetical protein